MQFFEKPSLRLYVLAWQRKSSGLPWKPQILDRCFTGVTKLVAQLKADDSIPSEAERVRRFVETTGKSRATYFNHARKLQRSAVVPNLRLTHTAPPAPPAEPEEQPQEAETDTEEPASVEG